MSELPVGWAEVPLDRVAGVLRGVTYKKNEARSGPAPDYLPILRATNIEGRLLLDTQMVYVPASVVRPEQLLRVGDIVIAASSGSLGVVGKSAQLHSKWEGAFGAFCSVVRPSSYLARGYLGYFVTSPIVRKRWRGLAQGTNINNLKSSDLAVTPVLLPPLSEQERIVLAIEEQLSRLDAARASLERVVGPLTTAQAGRIGVLRSALLSSAFSGEMAAQDPSDEPVSALLELIASDAPSGTRKRRGKATV